MTQMPKTPLDRWIAATIGLDAGHRPTPGRLARYQLAQLNRTLTDAARRNPFYRQRWGEGRVPHLTRLAELCQLPFTTAEDLQQAPTRLLSVSQGEVARVVTLNSSGTTGTPKRIFFGEADLEKTIDFFHHGMATLVRPGQRVLILLPGDRPGSVGDLLREGLARMDVMGVVHGPVRDPAAVIRRIGDDRIDSLVGIPTQVLALARHPHGARIAAGRIRSVLLSTDYVPLAVVSAIQRHWGCEVFQHYGMTEMGFGGGVACAAHEGYHLREADLFFEIIDPKTLGPAGPGRVGEVVFTTLDRHVMPLIRYRTGDLAAWITTPCPCGSALRRMGWVRGRRREIIRLAGGSLLDLADLDEVLFALPGVIDFQATVHSTPDGDRLQVTLLANGSDSDSGPRAMAAVMAVPAIRAARTNGTLYLAPIAVETGQALTGSAAKRKIVDMRPESCPPRMVSASSKGLQNSKAPGSTL